MEQVSVTSTWEDDWDGPWGTVGPPVERTLEITAAPRTVENADG
jgi:hypothetical protein